MAASPLVLGCDAAWGGLGFCLALPAGPLRSGHVRLGGATWRWPALCRFLDGTIRPMILDAEMEMAPGDVGVRLVIEEPPVAYSGSSRGSGGFAGNQSATCFGLGRLAGAVEVWWVHQRIGAYPWLVTPSEWRKWMDIGGKGRVERKLRATKAIEMYGWGRHLDPYPWTGDDGGARGDVAEAILLAVGAARNIALAPAGPMADRPEGAPKPPPKPRATKKAADPKAAALAAAKATARKMIADDSRPLPVWATLGTPRR